MRAKNNGPWWAYRNMVFIRGQDGTDHIEYDNHEGKSKWESNCDPVDDRRPWGPRAKYPTCITCIYWDHTWHRDGRNQ